MTSVNSNLQVKPYRLDLPLKIAYYTNKKGESKYMRLNLNEYRNAPYFKLNQAKIGFKLDPNVNHQINQLPKLNQVRLVYTVFFDRNALFDVANVCSVVDKFFSDALVEAGKLEDDNYHCVSEVVYRYGGIDKANPRVEVEIWEIKKST